MADIKISQLGEASSLEGVYTIGVDKYGLSKKVSLQSVHEVVAEFPTVQQDVEANRAGIGQLSEALSEVREQVENNEVLIEDLQNTKIDKEADDYYPQLSVGTADNLSGVDEVASEFNFRRSGGGAIADGVARVQSIKGNSVVIDGEIVNMKVIGIKSVGRNQWNEQWELGGINSSDGKDYDATNRIKSGYIRILANTMYYFKKPQGIVTLLYFYDENKNYVGFLDPFVTSGVGGVFTTMNASYMRFMVAQDTYHHDICLNLSDTEFNGQYAPYMEAREDLSIVAKYFPNGMRSEGSAYDEIRYNKQSSKWEAIKRIGEDREVLSNPIVTEIEEKGFNLDYLVWNCGTETALAEGKSSALSADITYGINAVGLIKQLRSLVEAMQAKLANL